VSGALEPGAQRDTQVGQAPGMVWVVGWGDGQRFTSGGDGFLEIGLLASVFESIV
jgi:hypothetical protein